MSCIGFCIRSITEIISTVLAYIDQYDGGQHGICAKNRIALTFEKQKQQPF